MYLVLDFKQQRVSLIGLAIRILLIGGKQRLCARRQVQQSPIAFLAQLLANEAESLRELVEFAVDVAVGKVT
ncbi:hypothetical protein [Sphingomonas sp. 28-62-20]|uniref:hypothetical protein n=1 Tax=Sphingomonas sp. 28-62-20 TaxID=1970433 RepID=UPI0035A92200